jgi:hypothetical protein
LEGGRVGRRSRANRCRDQRHLEEGRRHP